MQRGWWFCLVGVVWGLSTSEVRSEETARLPSAKPVPRVQVLPLPGDEAAVRWDGREWSRLYFDASLNRPFLYPMIGPSGVSLTRMGHPHDPAGHSHHNSVWLSHNDVGGINFWGDSGAGKIEVTKIARYIDGDTGVIDMEIVWREKEGKAAKVLLTERRQLRFQPMDKGEWMLLSQSEFRAADQPVELGKSPFGMIGVRMAKTIGVHDGGGRIRNSEGSVDEKEVFWKAARWVDYSGQVAEGVIEGITLFDHPGNPNHPSKFHVRDDGWMGASLTFDAPMTIGKETPLVVRYGLWVHAGLPTIDAINQQWERYGELAATPVPEAAK